jgi:L-idonate 5-dehydrogenase
MRALVIHGPRDLRVEERDIPLLGPGDVEVRVRTGGICGSDLHYYKDGGFGSVRLRHPMILGHEVAGEVTAVGAGVTAVSPGDRVVVNPSLSCGTCRFCKAAQPNHCMDLRFYGSAMRLPHVDGAFREAIVCRSSQAVVIPPTFDLGRAAFAEPFAVALHAAARAGDLTGRTVLVIGVGPIGALCILAARYGGAREIIAIDRLAGPLRVARGIGADRALNTRAEPRALEPYAADKGSFDVVFEASGSTAAIATALPVVKPGGVVVLIGLGEEAPLPVTMLVSKEVSIRGSFRFHDEFALAARLIASGDVDVAPLLTRTIPLDDASRAFELAADREHAMKVQLAL